MQDPVLIPPSTPLRSTTPLRPRSIFDVRHPHLVRDAPSSPASSSELSPITQDIMTDLRKQRSRARSFWRRGRDSPGTER
ncbi:hypothetical protein A0H81_06136 [Grifola frondosa]|uniref:Uncharacterized protein n=1 Tax=Grifola frondosa TaxID=5627 RepID=A0A1C7MCY8_GRIFR|nr:hypothetical protein A0H81_06136 [Grifola frondosa]